MEEEAVFFAFFLGGTLGLAARGVPRFTVGDLWGDGGPAGPGGRLWEAGLPCWLPAVESPLSESDAALRSPSCTPPAGGGTLSSLSWFCGSSVTSGFPCAPGNKSDQCQVSQYISL